MGEWWGGEGARHGLHPLETSSGSAPARGPRTPFSPERTFVTLSWRDHENEPNISRRIRETNPNEFVTKQQKYFYGQLMGIVFHLL